MRTIEGYVFVPFIEFPKKHIMFGPKVVTEGFPESPKYQALSENRLSVFDTELEARNASDEFTKLIPDEHKMNIAKIYVKFAETREGCKLFESEEGLIAISNPNQTHTLGENGTFFYGPIIEGIQHAYPLPASNIECINFTTYMKSNCPDSTPFEDVMNAAGDIGRQKQQATTIGQFKLEFL